MILKILPGWYRRNFFSVILLLTVFTAFNVFVLNSETIFTSLVSSIKATNYRYLKLSSKTWTNEQRKEIIGFAEQIHEVGSVAEVKTLRWANQLPLIKGISFEYLKKNKSLYQLKLSELTSFQNSEDAAFVSINLAEHFGLKLHRQYNWFGLIFRVKGFFESNNPEDTNAILLHRSLIDKLPESDSNKSTESVFLEFQLVSSYEYIYSDSKMLVEALKQSDLSNKNSVAKIPPEVSTFIKSLTGFLINVPRDLTISTQPSSYESAFKHELIKLDQWKGMTTFLMVAILFLLFLWGVNYYSRLETDLKFLHDFAMNSRDFFWLILFYNFFLLLASILFSLIIFALLNENSWLAIKNFTITQNLTSEVFLNWLKKLGIVLFIWSLENFIVVWLIVNPNKFYKSRYFLTNIFKKLTKALEFVAKSVKYLIAKK